MKRKAYTLIEMIFAIVLLGMIGGMISGMLGKVYENYAQQQEISKLEFSSIEALNQISNYLKRSIPNSIMQHDGSKTGGKLDVYNSNAYIPIRNVVDGNLKNDKLLLWLDIDKESLQGDGPHPYYNQWLNIKASSGKKLESVDSKFSNIIQTEKNIFGTTSAYPAVYFIYGNRQGTPYEKFYNTTNTTDSTALFPIDQTVAINDNDFQLTKEPKEIGELFYITSTGYALKLVGKTLYLIYNFKPWVKKTTGTDVGKGETVLDGSEEVLLENVKSFDYWIEYDSLRIKICVESNFIIGTDGAGNNEKASICKEHVIGNI